jgi:hypothetical protein
LKIFWQEMIEDCDHRIYKEQVRINVKQDRSVISEFDYRAADGGQPAVIRVRK